MSSTTSWLYEHRHEVLAHYEQFDAGNSRRSTQPACVSWWIIDSVTCHITSAIHSVLMQLQGHRLTLSEQKKQVEDLIVTLSNTIGAARDAPIDGMNEIETTHVIRNNWSVYVSEIQGFVEYMRDFSLTALENLDESTRNEVFQNIAFLIFDIVNGSIN